jgi:hypothetical protein
MKKEFVPYELALRMKQLGFDERCIMHWWKGKLSYYQMGDFSPTHTPAPTFSQVFRWFREKGYRYTISSDLYEKNGRFYFDTWTDGLIVSMFESGFKYTTYEEAELACLKKLIEIVEK